MFNKRLLNTVFAAILGCSTSLASVNTTTTVPPSTTNVTAELTRYYKSGTYNNEIIQVGNQALLYLVERINLNQKVNNHERLAIVLDIDETALSNYPFLEEHNFEITAEQFFKHLEKAKDHPLLATLAIYDYAVSNNIAVFFVSSRPEKLRDATLSNLRNVGYNSWAGIYFKPNDYSDPSIQPYKTKARKEIIDKGYTIIFTIGDQQSDLEGGYAEKTFKLPNPFYTVP